jgi:hypothetical protein
VPVHTMPQNDARAPRSMTGTPALSWYMRKRAVSAASSESVMPVHHSTKQRQYSSRSRTA